VLVNQQAWKRNCQKKSVAELKPSINYCCLLSASAECRAVLMQMQSGSEGRREEEKRKSVRGSEEKGDRRRKWLELNLDGVSSNNGNKGLTGDKAWVASTDTGFSPTGVQEIGCR
jgi:hypothetical protein